MEKTSEIRYLLQPERVAPFHSVGQRTIVSDFFTVFFVKNAIDKQPPRFSFRTLHSASLAGDIAKILAFRPFSSPKVWSCHRKKKGWRNFHPVLNREAQRPS